VFPEYYLIPLSRLSGEVQDDLDEWLYAFKNTEELDEFHSDNIDALKAKLRHLLMDPKTLKRYTCVQWHQPKICELLLKMQKKCAGKRFG